VIELMDTRSCLHVCHTNRCGILWAYNIPWFKNGLMIETLALCWLSNHDQIVSIICPDQILELYKYLSKVSQTFFRVNSEMFLWTNVQTWQTLIFIKCALYYEIIFLSLIVPM